MMSANQPKTTSNKLASNYVLNHSLRKGTLQRSQKRAGRGEERRHHQGSWRTAEFRINLHENRFCIKP